MTLSQALESVSKFYVPGVVRHFAQLSPDPWQSAHDELENIAGTFDPDIVEAATDKFVVRCLELVERFKVDSAPPKSVSPSDSFAMNEQRVRQYMSRKHKYCVNCGTKEGLNIVGVPHSMDVQLMCNSCKGKL